MLPFKPLATFREQEGMTLIVRCEDAKRHSLVYDLEWACITLTVHSSLQAVGFLAIIMAALAEAGISVNPISAFFHDYLFVPWEGRIEALEILEELSRRG
jgi:hypothetical protein